jgi:DNA-binding MarR family transcriptional regulator
MWMRRQDKQDKKAAKRDSDAEKAAPARTSPAHDFFIYKVGILRRLLDRYSTPALTDQFDLTVAEWRVLTQLYSSSPTTAWQLCLRVHADKAEISRACAGLVERGLASRRADPKDRRSVLLTITPRGERLHDAIVPLRQALQSELEASLTKPEVAELHRLLDKLTVYVSQRISKDEDDLEPTEQPRRQQKRQREKPKKTRLAVGPRGPQPHG